MATYSAPTGPAFNDTDKIPVETNGTYTNRLFKEVAEAVAAYNQTVYPVSKLGVTGAGTSLMTPSAAYANSTTITDVATLTIPANTLAVNSLFHVVARAKFSTTSTPTLTLGLYWGGVAGSALAVTSATTTGTATNWPVQLEAYVLATAIGASGSLTAYGYVDLATSLTANTRIPIDKAAIAGVTVATNADKVLSIGATWGTQSVSNTLTVVEAHVSALNF